MIAVRVLYFASLRERLAVAEEQVQLAAGSTAADLIDALAGRNDLHRQAFADRSQLRIAHNRRFASADAALADGDEVGLFPPVTGG
ncbi:MAG: molybdopterin converting factor subunit 1 [Betaproteobacteria bacterium]|nr:molybdopterin converting factor subunit 1 [Betaproteobacteria bacterium]